MSTTLPVAGEGRGFAPELKFEVREGGVLQHAAVPTLRFVVGVGTVGAAAQVKSVALNVEVHPRTCRGDVR